MNIQHRTFPDGSFVLHRIPGINSTKRISAWYDRNGEPIEAEHLPSGRFVGRKTSYWQKIIHLGKVYKPSK